MPHLRVVAQTSCLQSGRLRYDFPPMSEALRKNNDFTCTVFHFTHYLQTIIKEQEDVTISF